MTKDEIKEMFQANAALRKSFPADPEYPTLLNNVQKLTAKYIHDTFGVDSKIEQPKTMAPKDMINIFIDTVKQITMVEAEICKNGGMTNEQMQMNFNARNAALELLTKMMVDAGVFDKD